MRITCKLYGQFFKTTISQSSTLIVFIAGFILNAVFIAIVPIAMYNNHPVTDANIWEIKTMSRLISICTVALFCSVLGEIIANPNDRIFILSRPIKRSIYLTAKLILSLTFAIVFAALISASYVVLQKWCDSKNVALFSGKMKFEYMILLTFILCILGATAGVSLRYYSREMIVSIIVLVVVMSYGVGFSFPITQTPSEAPNLEYLESYFIPLTVILPMIAIIIGVGFFMNHRINIGV